MTTAPDEHVLLQILDRLSRQERRTDIIEATVQRLTPASTRPVFSASLSASSTETPPEIPWPRREIREAAKPVDRVKELEARLAEAEERLRIASRLETVGRLIAGVSHDFNNLLTIITGNADVIRTELPADHPLRETAELISSTAQTAATVTRQLVQFGKPTPPDPCPVDANAAIRALERTLSRLTGGRVTLHVALATSVPLVRIDPGQFDQVLLNLVVNARDAIRDSGGITVRTAATTVPTGRVGWPAHVPPGEFLVLTVSDSGMGMADDVKARVFDLFFTTKGAGGSGVGLATVKEIVSEAGGHIEIESAPDWGTSVRVFWPAYPEAVPSLRLTW